MSREEEKNIPNPWEQWEDEESARLWKTSKNEYVNESNFYILTQFLT